MRLAVWVRQFGKGKWEDEEEEETSGKDLGVLWLVVVSSSNGLQPRLADRGELHRARGVMQQNYSLAIELPLLTGVLAGCGVLSRN